MDRLIPVINIWLKRKQGDVNYNLIQCLTVHGGYRNYMNRFGHDNSSRCPQCTDENETAEHVTFTCPRFSKQLTELEIHLRKNLSPDNIIGAMLDSKENWASVNTFTLGINLKLCKVELLRRSAKGPPTGT